MSRALPSREESTQVIGEIVEAWHLERPSAQVTRRADPMLACALFAHVAHVHRLAAGVLALYAAENELVAVTLIRQMIEAGMRAAWLSVYQENLPDFVRDGERQRKNMLESAVHTRIIPEEEPALRATLDWLEEHERTSWVDGEGKKHLATDGSSLEELCNELEDARIMYSQYRLASNFTHPGTLLLEQYVEAVEGGEGVGINFITQPELDKDGAWLCQAGYMLTLSALIWSRIDKMYKHRPLLRRAAQMYDVPTGKLQMTNEGYLRWRKAERVRERRN